MGNIQRNIHIRQSATSRNHNRVANRLAAKDLGISVTSFATTQIVTDLLRVTGGGAPPTAPHREGAAGHVDRGAAGNIQVMQGGVALDRGIFGKTRRNDHILCAIGR